MSATLDLSPQTEATDLAGALPIYRKEATEAVLLDGIAQRLGRRWALRGVSLSVQPGELVAIVGHNGSGKTTLLRVVSTALRPSKGSGSVFGHDLVRDADGVRSQCAMLTHSGGLYGDLTAAENLEFAQRMAGERVDREMILATLDSVGMRKFADTRVRTFSSGMQRRTAIARLRLRWSSLLLLDEPYNSLDGAGTGLIDDTLTAVRDRNGAALVVLHDLERTSLEFDRVVELKDGRLVGGGR